MQAAAIYNRRALSRIQTQGRTKKSNEMNPISTLNDLNPTTHTHRLPLTILNRSTSRLPPASNSNPKRTKTAPLPPAGNHPSLYSHSNHSGDLLSGSRSPIALVRSTPALSITTRLNRLHGQRRWPPISLLRSRRKLWKRYWLVVNLPTIQESNENTHEIESVHRLRSRSDKLISRKPPPLAGLPSTTTVRPLSRYPPASTEKLLPPPPELDDDTGSESSSSDEDLDAYEFDLSCCSPLYIEGSVGVPDQPFGICDKSKDSRGMQHSKISVRVSNHLETDISSIYESIARRTIA